MSTLSLGPWTLPVGVLALVLGLAAALGVATFLTRRGHADAGNGIWLALVVALVVARIVYVARLWSSYRLHPWDILDLRDGGFDTLGGVIALVLVVALLAWRRPRWRRVLPACAAVGTMAWLLVGVTAWQLRTAAHPPLPALALRDLQGREVPLAALAGKPMVINLWATWCGPCRREMPVLVEAQRTLPQVRFVFADQGESAAQVRRFLDSQALDPRHVLLDSGMQLTRHYGVPGYPTTLFLDADGRLRDMHTGPLSHATLRDRLQRIAPLSTPVPGEAP